MHLFCLNSTVLETAINMSLYTIRQDLNLYFDRFGTQSCNNYLLYVITTGTDALKQDIQSIMFKLRTFHHIMAAVLDTFHCTVGL